MKSFSLKIATVIAFVLWFAHGVLAQNTCQSPKEMEQYLFPGQYMDVFFTTAGVPNDNATALPLYCTTPVGTGGQRWYSMNLGNIVPINVTIETKESSSGLFDTKLHVYTGSCGAFTCVAGDDDGGEGNYSLVNFTVQPNTTYFIRVGGYNAAEGVTNITLDAGEPGCTDPTAHNYDWTAQWDDGTCCYDGYVVISLNNNGGQPWENTMTLRKNGINQMTIHPGAVDSKCMGPSCDMDIVFTDTNGGGWGTSTFSYTVNGELHQLDVPEPSVGSSTSTYTLDVCGCTNYLADNYDPMAFWDDGSCCYNSSISLNGGGSATGYAALFINYAQVASAYENDPASNFCAPKECGMFVQLSFTSPGAICTVILDGEEYNFVSTGAGYQIFQIETSFCGCMDPTALNYNPTAYLDGENCYYVENVLCENALLMDPNTYWLVNTTNVPINQFGGNCGWISNNPLLWFKFVYNGGSISIETTNSTIDTVLGLFSECDGDGNCIDDSFNQYTNNEYSTFNINASISYSCEDGLTRGHTYYVAAGRLGNAGEFPMKFEVHDVPGCMDVNALNYSSCASYDDGSCMYPNSCTADLDGNLVVNVSDLLLFAAQFGTVCNSFELGQ